MSDLVRDGHEVVATTRPDYENGGGLPIPCWVVRIRIHATAYWNWVDREGRETGLLETAWYDTREEAEEALALYLLRGQEDG